MTALLWFLAGFVLGIVAMPALALALAVIADDALALAIISDDAVDD